MKLSHTTHLEQISETLLRCINELNWNIHQNPCAAVREIALKMCLTKIVH